MLTDPPAYYVLTESDRLAVETGYRWDAGAVDHVVAFSKTLRDPMDPEKPYNFLDWQYHGTSRLFGWRRDDGRRRFTRLNLWIPKKNGKTSWVAFLALTFLLADGQRRPGCYVTSATGELAEEIYTEAKMMTQGTPWRRILDLQNFRNRMKCLANGGEFRSLAASAEGAEGVKGSFVALDEIHATLARKPKLYGALRYAGAGRKQPLTITTSTAGDDPETLAYKIYRRSKAILAGEILDVNTLAMVYEAPEKETYTPDDFKAANPAVGEILELQQLIDDYQEARTSEYDLENFLRYRLNIWTRRSTAWLTANNWQALADPQFDLSQLSGLDCYVGIDLSGGCDLVCTAAVVVLPTGRVFYWPHFWIPQRGIEDRTPHEMDYPAAAGGGHITLAEGADVDFADVGRWVKDLHERYGLNIRQVGFDPYKASELAKELANAGLDCVAIKQGWGMSEPSLKFQTDIETGQALHLGNPIMTWCVGNVEKRTDPNGKIRPVKGHDRRKKIDGVVAAIMGRYLSIFGTTALPPAADQQLAMLEEKMRL